MTGCCNSGSEPSANQPRAARCPGCGQLAKAVGRVTLLHQVMAPLNRQLPDDRYYFCASFGCDRVYFSAGGVEIGQQQLRSSVGQKSTAPDRTLCYCFDVSHDRVVQELAETGESASKSFVAEQTRLHSCSCESRNPSGRCCLADFPR